MENSVVVVLERARVVYNSTSAVFPIPDSWDRLCYLCGSSAHYVFIYNSVDTGGNNNYGLADACFVCKECLWRRIT